MLWLLQNAHCTVDLKKDTNLDYYLCSNTYFPVTISLVCFTEILIGFFQLSKMIEDFFLSPASEP